MPVCSAASRFHYCENGSSLTSAFSSVDLELEHGDDIIQGAMRSNEEVAAVILAVVGTEDTMTSINNAPAAFPCGEVLSILVLVSVILDFRWRLSISLLLLSSYQRVPKEMVNSKRANVVLVHDRGLKRGWSGTPNCFVGGVTFQ